MERSKRPMLRGFAAAIIAGLSPVPAAAIQPLEKTQDICAEQAARVERSDGIPRHLLRAIGLAESGRWDETRQASFAWPWTVTAEGEGRFHASKGAAVAAVRALMARGVTNIDVGCMQVNLHYHGGAFRNLEEALDPKTNVAYAAGYLKGLFGAARSWPAAAAHYHSTNPEKNAPYRRKVMRLWKQARQETAEAQRPAAARTAIPAATLRPLVAIDRTRTAALNARFKATRAAESSTERPAPQAGGGAGALKAAAAAASGRTETNRYKGHPGSSRSGDDFAARRQAQLEAWRRRGTWAGTF